MIEELCCWALALALGSMPIRVSFHTGTAVDKHLELFRLTKLGRCVHVEFGCEALENQGLGESCIHHSSTDVDTIISSSLRENTIEGYASLLKYIKANHSKTRHVTRIDCQLSEMDFAG